MLIYAFFVYLPGLVAQALLELKGTSEHLIWRKIVMIASWYTVACGLFMSLFIIGYIILFVNCKGGGDTDCKSGLGGKIGACILIIILQTSIQVYLAMVATRFYQAFDTDNQTLVLSRERKKLKREMKS